jgi:predicted LPLAT superfamily acyltransferase
MTQARSQHWAQIGESTSVGGIAFLCAVDRWLGRVPFRVCLYPVVLVHWTVNRTARRASMEYLRRLDAWMQAGNGESGIGSEALAGAPSFPTPHSRSSTRSLVTRSLRHFACFAETLLDKLLASGGRYPAGKVKLQREVMLRQVASGQGGVIITAHIGCLELCQALADQVPGFRLTALVHTAHAQDFNRLLRRLNPDCRVELLQVTSLDAAMAMELGRRVAAGEFVAIAGDRVPVSGSRSVRAEFLGQPAPFPIGPYVLAAALGCPLFAMACTHDGDGYRIAFEQFSERVVLPRNARDAALTEQAAHFARWLEEQLRHAPFDWFNFFPFWDQATPQGISTGSP